MTKYFIGPINGSDENDGIARGGQMSEKVGKTMCDGDWTSERPTEEGFYWFYGWSTVSFRNTEPYLTIVNFWSGGQCMIGGIMRYGHETLGLWKKIEAPDISPLTVKLEGIRDAEVFSHAAASRGS